MRNGLVLTLAPLCLAVALIHAQTQRPERLRAIPFHGTIVSVDEKRMAFAIGGKDGPRWFKITDATVITRADQPASMREVVINAAVRGSYYKRSDSAPEAKTVKLGPLTETTQAPDEQEHATSRVP